MNAPEIPTWIACLTTPGQSALATLGLYGPRAWDVLRKLFRRRSSSELAEKPVGGRFWLGRIGGEVADDVVVAVKQIEPVPWLEVHGHGGREVVRFLIELFREQGLHLCSWEDFLRKTSADALSAEAVIALAHAATPRTAGILLDQQHGALGQALEAIQHALERGETATAEERLAQLARYAPVGRHLTQPWRVVVAGAPNVGKSSLVNALAGYQRSIVAATPGTTLDVVTTRLALDGWLIELADTAGQRSEAEALEEQGIRRARATAAAADLCLWVLDASVPPVWPDEEIEAVQYIVNKIDLPRAWSLECPEGTIQVSAKTRQGLVELCATVAARLVPDPPPSGAAVPFTPRLCEGIAEAQGVLAAGDVIQAQRILSSLFEIERG
ncbi:MAG TPA: GTPase [Gemmataceae bacterium]|nr:GTPase [Gemmataceae bacterium]